jgi:FMN phosphatase YigB (HAD superfamily)
MGKLLVFDLDDTLLHNKHNYSSPMLDAVRLMLIVFGHKAPYIPALMALVDEIDRKRVKEIDPTTGTPYLYNRRRFPGSLVATYEKVCGDIGVSASSENTRQLLAIGEKAFAPEQYRRNIVPDAERVLQFLKQRGHILVLCTKGDPEIQQDKLNVLKDAGLLQYFTETKIVDQKDSLTFSHIKDAYPERTGHAYSVGNMYRGDILPALESGYHGVYIPDEHWETAGDLSEINYTRVLVLNSLGELIDRYGDLT